MQLHELDRNIKMKRSWFYSGADKAKVNMFFGELVRSRARAWQIERAVNKCRHLGWNCTGMQEEELT